MASPCKSCSREGALLRRFLVAGSIFALAISALTISARAMPADVTGAVHRDLEQGRADSALQQLDTFLGQHAADAEAHNLRCRVYYQEEHWDQAIADCQAAVELEPGNSLLHLWLGRAYGQKAAHISSLMTSYKLARKVAAEFQQAVKLDPNSAAALADLGEFDVNAPAIAGGGMSGAKSVLAQLWNVSPAGALLLQARIAEEKRDYPAAEADLKAVISQSKDPANAWMDLAAFYRRRGRLNDMVTAARNGAAVDHQHGPALVAGATDLAETGQDPKTAIQWLKEYLDSQAKSEEAPAFAAHAQLAMLLENEGDEQGAQQQLAEVHSLASGYRIPVSGNSARAGR